MRHIAIVCLFFFAAGPALAQQDDTELAKQTQNPIANLISVPLQNNFNFGVGPGDDLQYVLNIQPVIPIDLGEKFMLINRAILPVMYQPELGPGVGQEWGLGRLTYQGYFSPKNEGSSGKTSLALASISKSRSIGVPAPSFVVKKQRCSYH